MQVPLRPEWHRRAACKDAGPSAQLRVEVMVGARKIDDTYGIRPDFAKRYCQRCDVVRECLETALANPGLRGVWGGMTDAERDRERDRRTRR